MHLVRTLDQFAACDTAALLVAEAHLSRRTTEKAARGGSWVPPESRRSARRRAEQKLLGGCRSLWSTHKLWRESGSAPRWSGTKSTCPASPPVALRAGAASDGRLPIGYLFLPGLRHDQALQGDRRAESSLSLQALAVSEGNTPDGRRARDARAARVVRPATFGHNRATLPLSGQPPLEDSVLLKPIPPEI